ncbi:MAG TPA: alpha/beta hydrolase [Chitinophagaceae bacterium]|nr:alpha/beta hydrolase [Chitinophagaceae bacterium]
MLPYTWAACICCLLLMQGIATTGQTGFIKAGQLQVYYKKLGTGKPLVFLHAGYQDMSMWDKQVSFFSPHHSVILFDLPGHGATKGVDTSLLVQDVLRICLDSLHIQKASFIGLSIGSSCATEFALAWPERVDKIVLVSPGLSGWAQVLTLDSISRRCFELLDKATATKNNDSISACFGRMWCVGPFRQPGSVSAYAREYISRTTLRSLQQHPEDNKWPRFSQPPAAVKINRMPASLLVIAGDEDIPFILSEAHWLHHSVDGSKEIIFHHVAHMLNLEIPGDFNKAVAAFLNYK